MNPTVQFNVNVRSEWKDFNSTFVSFFKSSLRIEISPFFSFLKSRFLVFYFPQGLKREVISSSSSSSSSCFSLLCPHVRDEDRVAELRHRWPAIWGQGRSINTQYSRFNILHIFIQKHISLIRSQGSRWFVKCTFKCNIDAFLRKQPRRRRFTKCPRVQMIRFFKSAKIPIQKSFVLFFCRCFMSLTFTKTKKN